MEYSKLISIIGLILNTFASIILIWPYIFEKHFIGDDFITDMNMKSGEFHQKKDFKKYKNNLLGLVFMCIGFIFQLIGLLISR